MKLDSKWTESNSDLAAKQDAQRNELETLCSFSISHRGFATLACSVVKQQRELFIYYSAMAGDRIYNCSPAIAAYDVIHNGALYAGKLVNEEAEQIQSCAIDARRVPGPMVNLEIQEATNVVLDGLLLKSRRATEKLKEHSELVRSNLKASTEAILLVVK